jgi:hypothetical protein
VTPTPGAGYDVFLSHDHADADAVDDLGRVLAEEFGFSVWLDRWICVPGESWQQAIAKGLDGTTTCAVCIGQRTARGWFRQEVERALNRQAADHRYRVIPVLLPDAVPGDPETFLPAFASLRTWVDFRAGCRDPRALHLLQHGIRGTAPGPWPPLMTRSRMPDATLDEVERDLRALDRIRSLLHESVLIDTQRQILARRFT